MPEEKDLGILLEWIMNPAFSCEESVEKTICGASKELLPVDIGDLVEELKPGRGYDCSVELHGCNTSVTGSKHCCGFSSTKDATEKSSPMLLQKG